MINAEIQINGLRSILIYILNVIKIQSKKNVIYLLLFSRSVYALFLEAGDAEILSYQFISALLARFQAPD